MAQRTEPPLHLAVRAATRNWTNSSGVISAPVNYFVPCATTSTFVTWYARRRLVVDGTTARGRELQLEPSRARAPGWRPFLLHSRCFCMACPSRRRWRNLGAAAAATREHSFPRDRLSIAVEVILGAAARAFVSSAKLSRSLRTIIAAGPFCCRPPVSTLRGFFLGTHRPSAGDNMILLVGPHSRRKTDVPGWFRPQKRVVFVALFQSELPSRIMSANKTAKHLMHS